MNNEQTLSAFWGSFEVNAYEESTVPGDASFPRITYDVVKDSFFGGSCSMSASIWNRSYSWARVAEIGNAIKTRINEGLIIKSDDGGLYIRPGSPFMQRISADNDDIRRMLVNIEVKYLEE